MQLGRGCVIFAVAQRPPALYMPLLNASSYDAAYRGTPSAMPAQAWDKMVSMPRWTMWRYSCRDGFSETQTVCPQLFLTRRFAFRMYRFATTCPYCIHSSLELCPAIVIFVSGETAVRRVRCWQCKEWQQRGAKIPASFEVSLERASLPHHSI